MSKIWNTPMNTPLKSSRLVRRVILDENLPAGWPVKWGHSWDIVIDGKLVPTGLKRLDWTGNQWKEFILKHTKDMHIFNFTLYTLILSYNPCDIFKYYKVTEMHGLNLADCEKHTNNNDQAYIAGWCNLSPIDNKPFVFINLSRCTNDTVTTATVFHEMMHLAGIQYDGCWDSDEENMITFAENETYKVVELINKKKLKDE